MAEKTVPLPIEQAYVELKNILLKNKCKIIEEEPPQHISVKQGSLSGIHPKSAKKAIKYSLSPEGTGTKITSSTQIASDWTNLTLFGNILAAVLAGVFLWIAIDMENYVLAGKSGFWNWLARAYGYPDIYYTIFMINVTRAIAIVLVLTIAAEIIIVIYVYPRKNASAKETLQALH